MGEIKCFFLEPLPKVKRFLRRYATAGDDVLCKGPYKYHNAEHFLDYRDVPVGEDIPLYPVEKIDKLEPHPLWPDVCTCGYAFKYEDEWQINAERLYCRSDTGEEITIDEAPVGAMWYADWYLPNYQGPDGHCLVVRLVGRHDWIVDGPCSNCTMPEDWHKDSPHHHYCWVRTGTPPVITVGKGKAGESCAAGAGSISIPNWHGFLTEGFLRKC